MRVRSVLLALATATGMLYAGAGTASASTPPTASITCDSTTNTISTHFSGTLAANTSYIIKFTASKGSQVTTAGAISSLPALNSSLSVPVTTGASPDVSVAGYTRDWQAADFVFYTETVQVTVQVPGGGETPVSNATCTRDQRVTVNLACDHDAQTITATSAGTGFPTQRPLRAEYSFGSTFQATSDSLTFTRQITSPPDNINAVTVPESGAWSDVGYVHSIDTEPFFLSEKVIAVVRDVLTNLVVGQGTASCVYADHRV